MDLLSEIADGLERGEHAAVRERVSRALEQRVAPGDVLERGLLAGMRVVGERFKAREIFLPEVLLSARAMQAGLEVLKPLLAQQGIPMLGKVVIGTVRGDLHDIGKNLVGIMLQGAGFEVIDLGKDVPPETFVAAAAERGAAIIGMSALLTTTMPRMREVVEQVRKRGLDGRLRIIVGGAPVSADFACEIGADAYAFDAASAVERVKALLAGS